MDFVFWFGAKAQFSSLIEKHMMEEIQLVVSARGRGSPYKKLEQSEVYDPQ